MEKKLTHRQKKFLIHFLDIYWEIGHALHYITVAERLGVGKVTAYEMLRVLEKNGLVTAEYQTNPDRHRRGRSSVLFSPTKEADQFYNCQTGNPINLDDWHIIKDQIIKKLREGQTGGYKDLLSDLLVHIPESRSPLIFATELTTMVIIMLATIQDAPELRTVMNRLRRIGLPQEISLNAMSGISMFLSALERGNRRFTTFVMKQTRHYEDALTQLNDEANLLLSEFTREVVRILAN